MADLTKKTAAFNVVAAIAMPILGVAISIFSFLNRRSPSWFAFAISIALIYSYLPLLWDARNNFFLIYVFRDIDFNLYTTIIDFLVNNLHLQFLFTIFIFGSTTVYILGKTIGAEVLRNHAHEGIYFAIAALTFLLTVEYRSIFDLQKTTLALAVCVLALNSSKKLSQYLLSFLAVMIHPLTLVVVVLFPFAKVSQYFSSRAWVGIFLVGLLLAAILTPDRMASVASATGFIPERLAYYLVEQESRFSSVAVTNLVWGLRVLACLAIALVSILQMKGSRNLDEKRLLSFLASLSMVTLIVSRNEVFVERYFIALVIFTAYCMAKLRFRTNLAVLAMIALTMNVALHGIYTLQLVHSSAYDVIMSSYERREMSLKGLYYPTALLLDYDTVGYSDELIMSRASVN